MNISEFMTKNVITLTPENTVDDAAKLMLEKDLSVLPIIDSDSNLVGIITESDFVGKAANIPHALAPMKQLLGQVYYTDGADDIFLKTKNMPLSKIMTKNPRTLEADFTLNDVIEMMNRFDMKRMPVVQNGKLVGIVTRHDILRAYTLIQPAAGSSETHI